MSGVGDIGNMGENIFAFWCSEAGLIANPSKVDKAGWDFFVDFPFYTGSNASEVHKAAATCQVQVKATRRNDKFVQVKLSNLRRMVTSQVPSFFVFVEFDDLGGVLGCYVRHVDEGLIKKVIERLYSLETEEVEVDLNKRKMVVRYGEENRLKDANGEEVKNRFIEYIGPDVSEYISWKKKFLETVGFEDGSAEICFKLDGEENVKDFVMMSLGVKKEVRVDGISGFEKRFGLLRKEPFVEEEGGFIELGGMQPISKGRLVVKEDKFSPGTSLDIDIYFSGFYASTPDSLKAFRASHPFFDAIFYPFAGKVDFNFSIDNEGQYDIAHFCEYLRFFNLILSSKGERYIEVFSGGNEVLGFYMSGKATVDEIEDDLEVFEECESLFKYFGIDKEAKVRAGEVIVNAKSIKEVNGILNKGGVIRVEFSEGKEILESDMPIAFLFQVGTRVGEYAMGAYIVAFGEVERLGDVKCCLHSRTFSVEKKLVVRPGANVKSTDLESVRREVINKYDEDYLVVVKDSE